jgi:hypothetical protein
LAIDAVAKSGYTIVGLSGVAARIRPFLSAFLLEGRKGDDAFMGIVLAILRQAAVETYAALAADPSFVIAVAQAALQLLGHLARYIKK